MSLTEKFEKRAYPVFMAALVLIAASLQISIYFNSGLDIEIVVLIALAIMAGLFFIDCSSKNPRLYILLGVVLAVGAIAVWKNKEAVTEFVSTDIRVKVIGLMIIAGVALYISQQFFALRILVCAGYWGAMIFLLYKNLFPVKYVMYPLAAELIMLIAEIRDRLLYKVEEKRNKKMFFLAPVVLILVLVLTQLPYNREPFQWTRTRRIIEFFTDKFEAWTNGLSGKSDDMVEFGIGFAGYTEDGGIFGNRLNSDKEALDLRMVGNEEHIYLVGNIKSEYTGRDWETTPENKKYEGEYEEYALDTAELLYSLYRAEILQTANIIYYLHFRDLIVNYGDIYTSSLFRPAKTISINEINNKGYIIGESDNVSFSRNQDNDTSYNLKYFAVNRSADMAVEFIKAQSQYEYDSMSDTDYDQFKRAVSKAYPEIRLPESENFEEELRLRAEYIRKTYLDLPFTITARTQQLANEITKDAETDYDKMVAIVEYLSDYTYTTTPEVIPEGKDAVDYFLFESKEGFCTYFATAAAVLGRCVDIPTRYMQGYLLDVANMSRYGIYSVKENQAHAWIECYFEGVGWLTFEPTPGNEAFLYQEWELPAYMRSGEDDDKEDSPSTAAPGEEETEEPTEEATQGADNDSLEEPDKKLLLSDVIKYIILAIVLFVIVYIIYLKASEHYFWRYYRSSSSKEKVRLDMWMILWILEKAGYPIDDAETLNDYVIRLREFYPDKSVVLANVANIYMKLRYSANYDATKEEQRMAQRLRLAFMDKTVNERAMARQGVKIL